MKLSHKLGLLAVILLLIPAASLTVSRFQNGAFSGYISLSGTTNRLTDSGSSIQYNGSALSGAISGTVLNSGTPASGSIPKYTDTTGTNIGPSLVAFTGPTATRTYTVPDASATLLNSTASGVQTFLTTPSSANLASAVTDETGSGALVFGTSPSLTAPSLGVATATSLSMGSTNVIGALAGKATSSTTFGGYGISDTSANLAAALTDETGTGVAVFGSSPTITTPVLTGLPTGSGVSSSATASTLSSRDSSANLYADNFVAGYTTTATAAGTTTLTADSTQYQFFTGTTTQTVTLPVTSTLTTGFQFYICNDSTGAVTVNSSGGNAVVIVAGGTRARVTCILTSGTTAASWSSVYWGTTVASGKNLTASNSITLAGTDATTMTFPTTSQTIPGLSQANTWSKVGAASTPAATFSGQPFAGTGTTSFPLFYLNDSTATASTTLGTAGTYLGVNGHGTADFLNFMVDGASKLKVDYTGAIYSLNTALSIDPNDISNAYSFFGIGGRSTAVGVAVSGVRNRSTYYYSWSSDTDTRNSADTFIARDAAATIQFGVDAASPIAQTLKAHDGSGTDKDGAKMTIEGGQSTGTGRGGSVITATSLTGSTGSSANSYTVRQQDIAKPVTLTEATATTIVNLAIGSSKYFGCTIVCTVNAGDGTDFQALTSTLNVNAVNKAGTVTTTITQVDGTAANSSGTLTPVTYTAVANGASVDVKCAATSSLNQTTLAAKLSITALNSDGVVTVTEQ